MVVVMRVVTVALMTTGMQTRIAWHALSSAPVPTPQPMLPRHAERVVQTSFALQSRPSLQVRARQRVAPLQITGVEPPMHIGRTGTAHASRAGAATKTSRTRKAIRLIFIFRQPSLTHAPGFLGLGSLAWPWL